MAKTLNTEDAANAIDRCITAMERARTLFELGAVVVTIRESFLTAEELEAANAHASDVQVSDLRRSIALLRLADRRARGGRAGEPARVGTLLSEALRCVLSPVQRAAVNGASGQWSRLGVSSWHLERHGLSWCFSGSYTGVGYLLAATPGHLADGVQLTQFADRWFSAPEALAFADGLVEEHLDLARYLLSLPVSERGRALEGHRAGLSLGF
jgi:hypothetical protein